MELQIAVSLTMSDISILGRMMTISNCDNQSEFIQRLIRQEWERNYSSKQSNADTTTVEQAQAAAIGQLLHGIH